MFVDASAIIAIVASEPDGETLSLRLAESNRLLISPIVVYEAVLGLRRNANCTLAVARETFSRFVVAAGVKIIPIDQAVSDLALDAHRKFGRGRHKAALNMGDCFAYACAKVYNVPLLFKGDDFVHTDIEAA